MFDKNKPINRIEQQNNSRISQILMAIWGQIEKRWEKSRNRWRQNN